MSKDESDDGQDLLREARRLTPALYALTRVLRFRGVAESGLAPLPPTDLDVLRFVLDSPGVGTSTLARELGLHASNVSTAVRGLVALGLVRREPDPHDRRAVQLFPTRGAEHGMALIEDSWAEIFADALATLPADQREALTAAVPALRALGAALRERRNAAR
ncbi:DNA-binding transcriptional regulator, MarR family [Streptoalloteichus tenebrarius]|uniref:DNA-binding transcriptional regulator, MarR family n=1 Tax=Streptoalloteichus tenebrarius (strain ATCC 17920 / DSM 40477 / JCM 4838 / CBS 697.72 / NBRC 16177 / NCIMB 11028 / NRRL B-12390 / A12253. 1 / ISP 5477) TaxID=1933 RepID=A0ABT1HPW3_STRSD|nr:helix-turn-helix domain-containing protein [Streptoalloteichus tenebrarius]MCP2257552.1 DNA-binding transcriptional regulator, MarR family [Streptoalloteichus tenebrarius]BFE98503.1 MarR family transcriptional regulator [Streptoalloteichus tenebrarius]